MSLSKIFSSSRTLGTVEDDFQSVQAFVDEETTEEESKQECSVTRIMIRTLILLRLLPEDEENWTRIQIGLRLAQWLALIPDFSAAVVSVTSFSHLVMCCGKPVVNLGDYGFDWCKLFERLTLAYLIMVVLEIYPVVRKGLPFNLINPPLGFFLTIVLFFDQGKFDAFIMWVLEALSVLFEYVVYRLKLSQRKRLSKEVAFVEQLAQRKQRDEESQADYDEYMEEAQRLLVGMKAKADVDDRLIRMLRYGLVLNTGLVLLILIFIILIVRAGGLCFNTAQMLNPLASDQLARCPMIVTDKMFSEVCTHEIQQCYIPYH